MKGKWNLIASIFELVIGIMGVVAFFAIGLGGEEMEPWLITVVVAAAIAMLGIFGLIEHVRKE